MLIIYDNKEVTSTIGYVELSTAYRLIETVLNLDEIDHSLVKVKPENREERTLQIRADIEHYVDIPSLLGKTANFTAAIANIQLHMMAALLKSTSFDAFKAEMMIYAPFIQQLQSMIANGEIMSVQSAQGAKDTDAIIEGLTALTQVARVIKAAKE